MEPFKLHALEYTENLFQETGKIAKGVIYATHKKIDRFGYAKFYSTSLDKWFGPVQAHKPKSTVRSHYRPTIHRSGDVSRSGWCDGRQVEILRIEIAYTRYTKCNINECHNYCSSIHYIASWAISGNNDCYMHDWVSIDRAELNDLREKAQYWMDFINAKAHFSQSL